VLLVGLLDMLIKDKFDLLIQLVLILILHYIFQQYFERYACEPNEFAVSGYDQVIYFLIHLAENQGTIVPDNFNIRQKLIGGTYQIKKKPNGKGFQNSKLNMIGFDSEFRIINSGY
jgi:hypothetical protein